MLSIKHVVHILDGVAGKEIETIGGDCRGKHWKLTGYVSSSVSYPPNMTRPAKASPVAMAAPTVSMVFR